MRTNWYIWSSYAFTIKGRIWSGRVLVAVVRFSTLAVDKKKLFFPCLIQYEPWLTHVIYWPSEVNREASLPALCTADRDECVTVFWRGCRSGKYIGMGLFYSLVNQFFIIAAVQSYTKTLIHRMLLTYLALTCQAVLVLSNDSKELMQKERRIIVFLSGKQCPSCLTMDCLEVHVDCVLNHNS